MSLEHWFGFVKCPWLNSEVISVTLLFRICCNQNNINLLNFLTSELLLLLNGLYIIFKLIVIAMIPPGYLILAITQEVCHRNLWSVLQENVTTSTTQYNIVALGKQLLFARTTLVLLEKPLFSSSRREAFWEYHKICQNLIEIRRTVKLMYHVKPWFMAFQMSTQSRVFVSSENFEKSLVTGMDIHP